MLDNASCGWCDVKLATYEAKGCSYLVDYPIELAYALLESSQGDTVRVRLERESQGWQTAIFRPGKMEVWEYDADAANGDGLLYEKEVPEDLAAALKSELASDIERLFDEWVYWTDPDENERVARRHELSTLSRRLSGFYKT